ncbi:hypothetical protein [Amycolatopsis sp. WGS_07]|uniref:hypothetical protein n=1 Tax=Amycolatopsis sp. WGS_07 TaxID=3076764 RepID=UPI003873C71F
MRLGPIGLSAATGLARADLRCRRTGGGLATRLGTLPTYPGVQVRFAGLTGLMVVVDRVFVRRAMLRRGSRSRVAGFGLVLASLGGRDVARPARAASRGWLGLPTVGGRGSLSRTWVLRSRGCGLGVGGRMGFRLGLGKGVAFRFRRSRLDLGGRTVPKTRLGSGCPDLIPVGIGCLGRSRANRSPGNADLPGNGCPGRNRANNSPGNADLPGNGCPGRNRANNSPGNADLPGNGCPGRNRANNSPGNADLPGNGCPGRNRANNSPGNADLPGNGCPGRNRANNSPGNADLPGNGCPGRNRANNPLGNAAPPRSGCPDPTPGAIGCPHPNQAHNRPGNGCPDRNRARSPLDNGCPDPTPAATDCPHPNQVHSEALQDSGIRLR